jgi:23S rRNA U2552 (ribose-2'-O)-methylase RlmE/FtsJ
MLFKLNILKNKENINILNITLNSSNNPEHPNEKYGYNTKLNIFRNKIDNINSDNWKKVRWYINVYDFQVKDPIINRAFYKYWEIINEFDIFEDYSNKELILHCAEAPGGFIQGTNIYLQIDRIIEPILPNKSTLSSNNCDEDGFITVTRKKKSKHNNYKIYTISLNKDLPKYKNYNLPSYNKNIFHKYLCITYGKDNTGDINNLSNIEYIKHIEKNPFYLITADGGFDEGTDFNNKEQLHYNLILSEIYAALNLQKQNGHFILKVFDILTETSINLLYLLSISYKDVYIYKPKTSRPTNSEKYIICKYFNLSDDKKEKIITQLYNLTNNIKKSNSKYVSFTLFDKLPEEFVSEIKTINTVLLDKQCSHLESAIELCNDQNFLNNYDEKLAESLEYRKKTFHMWEETYNLNSYV